MNQHTLAIWSLVPLPFLKPACTSGSSWFIILKCSLKYFEPYLVSMWNDGSQSVSSVAQLCPTLYNPMTAALQASLSITNSQSLPKFMSIESVMPSSHLILCCPLLLLPSIFPSIRVFSNESALCIRWSKYTGLNLITFSYDCHCVSEKDHIPCP